MLEYGRIDISDGIDVGMSDMSKECMLCHYWHFLHKNFVMVAIIYCKNLLILKILLLFTLKKVHT